MGIGAMFGSAVDSYQNSEKIARDNAWQDEQRAEIRRQTAQDVARDGVGSQGTSDAQTAAQNPGQEITPEWLAANVQNAVKMGPDALAAMAKNLNESGRTPAQVATLLKQQQQQGTGQPQGQQPGQPPVGSGIPPPSQPATPQVQGGTAAPMAPGAPAMPPQGTGLPSGSVTAPPAAPQEQRFPSAADIASSQPGAMAVPPAPVPVPAPVVPPAPEGSDVGVQGLDMSKFTPAQQAVIKAKLNPTYLNNGTSDFAKTSAAASPDASAPSPADSVIPPTGVPLSSLDNMNYYRGKDGKMYAATEAPRDAKPSEILASQAKRLLSLGDAKSVALGIQLNQHANETQQQEVTSQISSILSSNLGPEDRAAALVKLINGSSSVPGTAQFTKNGAGQFVLRSKAPGQDGTHDFVLPGKSPDAVIQSLVQVVRGLHDPKVAEANEKNAIQRQSNDQTNAHNMGTLAVQQQNANTTAANVASEAGLRTAQGAELSARGDLYAQDTANKKRINDGNEANSTLATTYSALTPEEQAGPKGRGLLAQMSINTARGSGDYSNITKGLAAGTRADNAGSGGKEPKPVEFVGPDKRTAVFKDSQEPAYHLHAETSAKVPPGISDQQYDAFAKQAQAAEVPMGTVWTGKEYRVGFQGADGNSYDNVREAKAAKPKVKTAIPVPASTPAPAAPMVGTGIPGSSDIDMGNGVIQSSQMNGRGPRTPVFKLKPSGNYYDGRTFPTMAAAMAAKAAESR